MTAPASADYVYRKVAEVLEDGTGLTRDPALYGSRATPTPLQHRSFRLELAGASYGGKARPGDGMLATETVRVHVIHELDPNSHDASVVLALQDVLEATQAVLTRGALSGLAQPKLIAKVHENAGGQFRTVLELELQWYLTLPAAE